MPKLPVLADVSNRLHADIAIVRLIRAGIPQDRISALFPQRRAPNSVCCWLSNFSVIPVALGLPVAAAGLLGRLFRQRGGSIRWGQRLDKLGLRPDFAQRAFEKLENGQIILCVHARNDAEAAIAWHIFTHVGADDVTLAESALPISPVQASPLMPAWAQLAA